MNCINTLSIVVVLCTIAVGTRAIYSDCGSADGSIESVSISKCAPTTRRCILKRNTNATMEISFKTNKVSDTLTAVVHGVILGAAVPFNLPNPNGCKDSGVTCPLQSGNNYKYVTTMPILGSYPRLTVDIKWELKDADGNDVICALIPAKIQ